MSYEDTDMAIESKAFVPTIDSTQAVEELARLRTKKCGSLAPFVKLFSHEGKPLSFDEFRQFEPLFEIPCPRITTWKTARQVGKSFSQAVGGTLRSTVIRRFKTLYVTPLYEQIRRFSSNYVRPLINDSPIKPLLVGPMTEKGVLQKTFRNDSIMLFSYASTDAARIRGISTHALSLDELQDFDSSVIPIILETLAASKLRIRQFTGTPLGRDNPVEKYWKDSSQCEWFILCRSCGYWNIPSVDHDLLKMLGPVRDDIGPKAPGIICANPKCERPVFPARDGRWVPRYPERMTEMAGYHISQPIMPMHYNDRNAWAELKAKQEGLGMVSPNKFHNEVLGESYDIGARLVTETELKEAACLPWENNPQQPDPGIFETLPHYVDRVLAIDWGGGGEKGVSFTVIALLGLRPDGRIDCIWGKRLMTPYNHEAEARECCHWFKKFRCSRLVHDYTGAGILRETFFTQLGFNPKDLFPVWYIGPAKQSMVRYEPANSLSPRGYWQVDKTRSLLYTCQSIKHGHLRFFKYDNKGSLNPGLIHDFLALNENKKHLDSGSDLYIIGRDEGLADDFAQAVNIGCACIWHVNKALPDFANSKKLREVEWTAAQLLAVYGPEGNVNPREGGHPL